MYRCVLRVEFRGHFLLHAHALVPLGLKRNLVPCAINGRRSPGCLSTCQAEKIRKSVMAGKLVYVSYHEHSVGGVFGHTS